MADLSLAREQQFRHMRDAAREIFTAALKNASIEGAFARHVHCERGVLRVCEDLYDLGSYQRVFVAAIGKAGHTMTEALVAQVGSRLEGIVASSVEPASQVHGFRYFRGGHPTPTIESIRAAEAILKSLTSLNAASLAIFLLSGGGSSIVEKPVDDQVSLPDLVATYHTLVHCGAPIAEINAIRKHISAVKGGRLAQAAYPAQQVSILVSDVPDSTPDALASGPTMPDTTSIYDCDRIAAKYRLIEQFPSRSPISLVSTRSKRRPSPTILRLCVRAGGRCFQTKSPSTKPLPPLPVPGLRLRSITLAMTGITKKPLITYFIVCASCAVLCRGSVSSPAAKLR